MKRIKRKQLKENEFASTLNRLYFFFRRNARKIAVGGGVILFAGFVFLGAWVYQMHVAKKESQKLNRILELKSELGEKENALAELKKLAGQGKYSRLGYLYLASHWGEEGKLDKAKSALKQIHQGKKDFIYYKAQDLMLQLLFHQENYDKAIQICEKIEKQNPKVYPLDVILYRKAQAYEKKGNKEKALSLYKEINENYSQTFYGYEASQKMKSLE